MTNTLETKCIYNNSCSKVIQKGWRKQTRERIEALVRYVITPDGLMSKYHTCLQGTDGGLKRWTPDAGDTPAPLIVSTIVIWGSQGGGC